MKQFAVNASLCLTTIVAVGGAISSPVTAASLSYNVTDLGTIGGSKSNANGINNLGQVVGYSNTTGDATFHAFRTAANSAINSNTDDLGTLGGSNSYANGINNSGQVVGSSDTTGNAATHAFRTVANSAINSNTDDLGTLGGSNSYASGINNLGEVVGSSDTTGNATHAFLYSDNQLYDLNNLVAANSLNGFSVLNNASAINDLGQILGTGIIANGQRHAFLATLTQPAAVPEPSSESGILVFSAFGVGIALKRRQKILPLATGVLT